MESAPERRLKASRFTNTKVLAPSLRHLEQWHVPIIVGELESVNLTVPQQQLPLSIDVFSNAERVL